MTKDNINIADMINKSRGDYAYTMLDVDSEVKNTVVEELEKVEGVRKVRVIA